MTKKELVEENKKLKETINNYKYFWETDALKSKNKTITILNIISNILLLLSAFLLGLSL